MRAAICAMLVGSIVAQGTAVAGVMATTGPVTFTVEGYVNATTAFGDSDANLAGIADGNPRIDAALRALARWKNPHGPDIGVRVVTETSPEDRVDLAEASLLVLGKAGRLEIGDRQGLPDVLSGYAPNNFTFTGAEWGPASGPSLDPGGGLQNSFFAPALRAQLGDLAVLGFAASLSDDRSGKLLYVSPKRAGWLAGVSYATDAADPRFRDLGQFGLTHDNYWGSNVLHVGGSYSYAHGDARADRRDLQSINLGATLVVDYDWMIGASVTYNGSTGLARSLNDSSAADAWGAVLSVNYNWGPWTAGAYAQRSSAEGDFERTGSDRLTAFEAGLSYRASTRIRLYASWYAFDFDDEGGALAVDRHHGNVVLVGLRATL